MSRFVGVHVVQCLNRLYEMSAVRRRALCVSPILKSRSSMTMSLVPSRLTAKALTFQVSLSESASYRARNLYYSSFVSLEVDEPFRASIPSILGGAREYPCDPRTMHIEDWKLIPSTTQRTHNWNQALWSLQYNGIMVITGLERSRCTFH
ncbi:hypothetical protein GY45DRAFT_189989 [Cubamyces sp. BRFM 1775]|nr:hypothetical protein GY45DRAFT_189989 [Cubamyces sp. BRFM 1775]